uniref:Putative secreted protein n=1 Tax=Anopheles triannulatus TaxID=58253 RepID=A0A2M4B7L2_9DIPT
MDAHILLLLLADGAGGGTGRRLLGLPKLHQAGRCGALGGEGFGADGVRCVSRPYRHPGRYSEALPMLRSRGAERLAVQRLQ